MAAAAASQPHRPDHAVGAVTSVTMPQLGESVTEGTVTRWLKREGDPVAKYEPIAEVITDKVNSEIPSPDAGVLARIAVQEGETVKVGTELCVIERRTAAPVAPAAAPDEPDEPAATAEPAASNGARDGIDDRDDRDGLIRRRSSPLVRRLAREHAVDIAAVTGTGTAGRVTKEDILAYIDRQQQAAAPAAPAPPEAPAAAAAPAPSLAPTPAPAPARPAAPPSPPGADEEVLPLSPVRRAIAEHMVRSVTTAPHAWTYVEVDVGGLVKWRERAREDFRRAHGLDLTYVPFVCKALVECLREHPILNSTWRDGQVVLKKRVHLGVAVALEDNLVVPVIKDADTLNVVGLARALHDLVGRARAGKLSVDDVRDGTFTLNNTGALGSVLSMPIINQPQAGILTMEAIAKRVVVTADDAIAVRPILNLCLSFDHRVCDGLQVGRFMQSLKKRLEAMGTTGAESLY